MSFCLTSVSWALHSGTTGGCIPVFSILVWQGWVGVTWSGLAWCHTGRCWHCTLGHQGAASENFTIILLLCTTHRGYRGLYVCVFLFSYSWLLLYVCRCALGLKLKNLLWASKYLPGAPKLPIVHCSQGLQGLHPDTRVGSGHILDQYLVTSPVCYRGSNHSHHITSKWFSNPAL